ncbi:helix-turn-helix domain-containing protein [Paenibacillus mesophilus]|uniref:AraC family transcriptional regulator n=1 Tax=Paenibacillus mesophilus TaxID=2582849 RepID=UPI00110E1375|nr:AraC family transcriptional regulator [Paenibacillus mesophilus]TMV45553.1 helix-turn-helix domain-containing protein [Paenibacillus mesophilus]
MSFNSTSVLYISRCKYKSENCVIDHCHNFHHLLYVIGGSGTFCANGVDYTMRKDDLYVIAPGTYHSLQSDSSSPLCTIEVKALVSDPLLESYLQNMSLKMIIPHVKMKMILEAMLEEATLCRPQYKEIITAHFIEFILNIQRTRSMADPEEERSATRIPDPSPAGKHATRLLPDRVDPGDDLPSLAQQYLHANYGRKIVLQELARQLTVSSAHLCRVFYERFRVSPMQYLNNWRIQQAKELLVNTELTVTEISAEVGFQSVHYLSRRFAAKENMSPLKYRLMNKEIVEMQIEDHYVIVDHHIVMQR